ncbi:MAG: hypothetical protein JWN40_1967, partial [Phycisphaerales bacterium]|nr:hypothetical protein [Phycisphaerales bacterium]
MPNPSDYPQTVAEVIDPPVRFRLGVIAAVRRFKRSKPWRGTEDERKAKFERLNRDLCGLYGKQTHLQFGLLDGEDSGSSHYVRSTDTITLCGRLSVLTFLHEFGHALGKDERAACRWSLNLFRAVFPVSFARCMAVGHTLRSGS